MHTNTPTPLTCKASWTIKMQGSHHLLMQGDHWKQINWVKSVSNFTATGMEGNGLAFEASQNMDWQATKRVCFWKQPFLTTRSSQSERMSDTTKPCLIHAASSKHGRHGLTRCSSHESKYTALLPALFPFGPFTSSLSWWSIYQGMSQGRHQSEFPSWWIIRGRAFRSCLVPRQLSGISHSSWAVNKSVYPPPPNPLCSGPSVNRK